MADKSPGKNLRKPALSIKERRAAKRAKAIESTPIGGSASADDKASYPAVLSRMRYKSR